MLVYAILSFSHSIYVNEGSKTYSPVLFPYNSASFYCCKNMDGISPDIEIVLLYTISSTIPIRRQISSMIQHNKI
jgi:hypothetical protein